MLSFIMRKLKIIFLFSSIFFIIYCFSPEKKLPQGIKIDKIIILKQKHRMYVYSEGKMINNYIISLGRAKGKKRFEGDKKTPEGIYFITNKNPNSSFHLNLGISYPNKKDIIYAKKHNKSPGGQIKIHGLKNGLGFIGKFHRLFDWTKGCIAVTNSEIEDIYKATPIGTKVIIKK